MFKARHAVLKSKVGKSWWLIMVTKEKKNKDDGDDEYDYDNDDGGDDGDDGSDVAWL